MKLEMMTLSFCSMLQKPRIRIEIGNHDIDILLQSLKHRIKPRIRIKNVNLDTEIMKT